MVDTLPERIDEQVWALIPARAGSKGVKDKNLQQLFGHSILGWSVMAALATNRISRVFVSTDSRNYAAEARKYGAEAPFLRPVELASDTATDLDVFQHFFAWALEEGGGTPLAVIHLRPTTPMRDPVVLDDCIADALNRIGEISAVRSVHKCTESPFKWFRQDEGGFLMTLMGDRSIDASNSARQTYPSVFIPNGYVDVVFPRLVQESGRLHGEAVRPFFTPPVIEIDSQVELDLLRQVGLVPPRLMPWVVGMERIFGQ